MLYSIMAKKIKMVEIEPGCIACGACEFLAPEVFTVSNNCVINSEVDFMAYQEKIHEAAQLCPVSVILVREIESV